MSSFFHGDPDGPPCRYVEPHLQAVASGRANPLARWYALAHAARCSRCKKFLDGLTAMILTLRSRRDEATDLDAVARLEELVKRKSR